LDAAPEANVWPLDASSCVAQVAQRGCKRQSIFYLNNILYLLKDQINTIQYDCDKKN
jgi:hypothetical protein